MGYSTDFEGALDITPAPSSADRELINRWLGQRHVTFDAEDIYLYDVDADENTVNGEPVADNGWNWVYGQEDYDDAPPVSPLDSNSAPYPLQNLWSDWRIEGDQLVWDESEKSYGMYEILPLLIDEIFAPKGYVLNGRISFEGERDDDYGIFGVDDNEIWADTTPLY